MAPFRLAAVLLACAALAVAEVRRAGLFIGVDRGLEGEKPLRYAAGDARAMAAAFRRGGTFAPEDVRLLANASLDQVRQGLAAFEERLRALRGSGVETMAVLYYSGHGSAEGLHVEGRILPRAELLERFTGLGSDLKILILDACESGDFLREKGMRVLAPGDTIHAESLASKGSILLSSSAKGENAQESEEYKGSVFTHHFVNGMRGLADYDGDGRIRLMEVFDYARVATRRERIQGRGGGQNPGFDFDLSGETDPVLARLGGEGRLVRLARMPSVPLEIYNARTMDLEGKIWLTGRDTASMELPAGRYVLSYPGKEGGRLLELDMTWRKEAGISPEQFARKSATLLGAKGGGPLRLRFHGLETSFRRLAPFGSPWMGSMSYVRRTYWLKQSLGLGFARSGFSAASAPLRNELDILGLSYSLATPLLRGMRGQAFAGAEGSWSLVRQRVRDGRFPETPVGPDGRPIDPVRRSEADFFRGALPLEAELYFPFGFWLSATAAPAAYAYRDGPGGGWTLEPGLEPGLALGFQF
jgi:hypothetical protein